MDLLKDLQKDFQEREVLEQNLNLEIVKMKPLKGLIQKIEI